jgi:phosphoglycolate phosphatase
VSLETVLFDLDGTLTDSGPGIMASAGYALAKMGLPPLPPDKLRSIVGPPLADSFRDLAGLDQAAVQRAMAIYRVRYSELGMYENAVYPGIPQLLEALVADGRRLAVATSKLTRFAIDICEHFGLATYFAAICGSDLAGHRHAKADIVLDALIALGVPAGPRVVLVGDRSYDVAGAHANGIACIGAGWGYGEPGELARAGADQIAGGIDELAALLGLRVAGSPIQAGPAGPAGQAGRSGDEALA